MTEPEPRPDKREIQLISMYREAVTRSIGKIAGIEPQSFEDVIKHLESQRKTVTLNATYNGDVTEHFGRNHQGLPVPESLKDLILRVYEDPKIIVANLRLSLQGARIDVVNPYTPQLPYAVNRIPVTPKGDETKRRISPFIWIYADKPEFAIYGDSEALRTEVTRNIRHRIPETNATFPFPETTKFSNPIPITKGLFYEEPRTLEILEGLVEIADNFPNLSAPSVSIGMPRTDYEDPF